MNNKIRALSFEDEDEIINLIDNCLKNNDNLYMQNILYTKRNVNNFFKIEILPPLLEKEPMIGYFINNKLVGLACSSLRLNKLYDCEKKIALGGITMVHTDFRKQGISKKLRKNIMNLIKEQGINRFIFDLAYQNEASFKSAESISKQMNIDANIVCFRAEANLSND